MPEMDSYDATRRPRRPNGGASVLIMNVKAGLRWRVTVNADRRRVWTTDQQPAGVGQLEAMQKKRLLTRQQKRRMAQAGLCN